MKVVEFYYLKAIKGMKISEMLQVMKVELILLAIAVVLLIGTFIGL